jgi:cyclopropane fatty-acyl-phospholipid synthase-like methyltransferase
MDFALPPEFFAVHRDNPREGPGTDASTLEALRRLPPLPPQPRVLDLGCGPGAQTLVLARALGTRIVAIDGHRPFLDQLDRRAAAAGLGHLVETRCADFGALDEPPGSVDLIWSEGAIFCLGFAAGIRTWRPLLHAGGLMVLTEMAWLVDDPPAEARAYFAAEYPALTTVAANVALARDAGMEVLDTFTLPAEAWWTYYDSIARRVAELRPQAAGNPALRQMLEMNEVEIEMYRRHGASYGYECFLLRRPG